MSTLINGTFIVASVYAIKLDVDGTVVAVGQSGTQFPISEGANSIPYTISNDFPTTSNAFDQTFNGVRDVVIARFSSDLSRLSYSSYLGGETAQSSDFPATDGAFSTTFNGGASDAFIRKFDTLVGSADPAPEPTPEPTPDPAPAENIAPIADAGSDQTVAKKTTVYLNGSNSSDSDGTIINYPWTQISGKTVKLKNTNRAIANFYSPHVKRGRTKTLKFN